MMGKVNKKNFLFFSKDGFTYDKSHKITNNIQLLGSGKGKKINEAFEGFIKNGLNLFDCSELYKIKSSKIEF